MAPRQVPFNHGCSPHIRTEPHGIQLLQEMPPWNLLRSKRPGRWRRDAKHLAEKPTGSIVGHEVPSPVKTTTSWDFDGFPTGSIRDEHFQWNEYRLNQIFGGGGPPTHGHFWYRTFFGGSLDHWFQRSFVQNVLHLFMYTTKKHLPFFGGSWMLLPVILSFG